MVLIDLCIYCANKDIVNMQFTDAVPCGQFPQNMQHLENNNKFGNKIMPVFPILSRSVTSQTS